MEEPFFRVMGLFAVIGTQGVVRNLNIVGSASTAPGPAATVDIGLLAGMNNGTVLRVNRSGTVLQGGAGTSSVPDTSIAGGLVGANAGSRPARGSAAAACANLTAMWRQATFPI
ncbi:hypothetical protein OKW33_006903 [Paraburkholderia atlantica]|uniref:hypothetical protein n=1 Tax=Paraburkholderia atlantica TaxID=2654982 RepID=UPI00128C87E2|nr:hypothetical protein [Paraburkholderia atlantica]MPW10173.1 hypothetical protein [Paraburkholderia atlantica]